MARNYRHIQEYETEILKLKEQGFTHKEVGEKLGFTQIQVKKFIERYHKKERKIAEGKGLKRNGRPPKDDKYTQSDI
ncbi:MAG: helix-turn-helix domain-containing protein [Ruminococcus sp.]|nr:helix-turn-helix domain-containing protein [Ruminococcus sp.]